MPIPLPPITFWKLLLLFHFVLVMFIQNSKYLRWSASKSPASLPLKQQEVSSAL